MKFESPTETNDTPPITEKTPEASTPAGLSRREFLTGSAVLLADAVTKRAHASVEDEWIPGEANEATVEYKRGITELHERARMSPIEHLAIFREMFDETGSWIHQDSGLATMINYPHPEALDQLVDMRTRSVEIFHTHPFAAMYRDEAILKKARNREISPMTMPPSFMDVSGAISTIGPLEPKQQDKITLKTVDPAGTWKFDLDRTHAFFTEHFIFLQDAQTRIQTLSLQSDIGATIKKYALQEKDPRIMFDMLLEKKSELSEDSRQMIEELRSIEQQSMTPTIERIVAIESSRTAFLLDAPELNELRDLYKSIGVTLTFTAHEE